MKKYGYKRFGYADDLIEWLNENQHINVINVNHIDRDPSYYYQVFYYTEDNTIVGDRRMG
jgi:hypothetical protein